jgi:peptidoglycan/xylan/chitin deacetylase (PgdA/CDA1 family)
MSDVKPVVIFSFDHAADPKITEFVLDEMHARDIQATLYVQTGLIGAKRWNSTAEHLQKLHDHGWDLGSHTVTHARLGFLNEKAIEHEMRESAAELKALGFTKGIRHFSYPESSHSPLSMEIAKKYFSTARLVTGKLGNHSPVDDERYLLDCLSMKAVDPASKAIDFINLAVEQEKVAHVMFEMIFHENPPVQGYLFDRFIDILNYASLLRNSGVIEIKKVSDQYKDF